MGNTIKISSGHAANCSVDSPCDGTTTMPNSGHTACGCS